MIPEQGWQCPLCKRIYSPRQEMCLYCGGEKKESININGPFIDYPFEINTTKCKLLCVCMFSNSVVSDSF